MYPNKQLVNDLKNESPNYWITYCVFYRVSSVTKAVPVGTGGLDSVLNSWRVLLIDYRSLFMFSILP
jgi:hypothetical protein